jgi:hypothetical protein
MYNSTHQRIKEMLPFANNIYHRENIGFLKDFIPTGNFPTRPIGHRIASHQILLKFLQNGFLHRKFEGKLQEVQPLRNLMHLSFFKVLCFFLEIFLGSQIL